ncbi:hypothetical protein [Caudoviricetes sp.]|nr:hypothetical protein [Caudoviricetes sp.]
MSIYDNSLMDSDLDAFKNAGAIQTTSITMSGVIGAGQRYTVESARLTVTSPDFAQFLFDSSTKHSGKFKNLILEQYTMVYESTNLSELTCGLEVRVSGNQIYFVANMFNPYAIAVTLQTTTFNFRYIPYEATF